MLNNLVNATYIAAGLMFILALAGLSKHETAKKGNAFGILGMVLALAATNYAIAQPGAGTNFDWTSAALLYGAIAIGAVIGTWKARRVEMTGMPELIALLHSFVGAAAVLVGFNVHLTATHTDVLHAVEVVLGIFIGAVTLTGSLVAWGKLNGSIASKPLMLPGRNWINLGMLVAVAGLGWWYVATLSLVPLLLVTLISLALGCHLVAAIGGADMPVVVSMLNSYSGWAAAFSGFMLDQSVLIITGALVGASGAILSYIMCRAMNRSFVSVILGGFGVVFGFQALTNLIIFSSDSPETARSVMFWTLGSLARVGWDSVPVITIAALLLTVLMVLCGPILDALASGDRTAQAVGVEPARARILLLIPVSAAIALAVATAGGIGFVGLVVPHLVRSFIGPAHRFLVLGSALAAGLFLVWADAFARLAFAPAEVPIGVVTGLVGAPWLVLLVRRQGHSL